jgi:GDPmannose 4,6-dehydratase
MKKILITGITGQDGYYLTKLLLEKGYEVHGTVRRSSSINTERIDEFLSKFKNTGQFNLHYSDLLDASSLNNLILKIEPESIYNLAAQSHVAVSFEVPEFTIKSGIHGTTNILEAIKNINKQIKYYQASSSEMFGGKSQEKYDENSKFDPKSPYAAAKVFSHELTKIYRDSYGMFCTNGILFNHESPMRGETFVTRKISRAVGRIHLGLQSKLTLGNLEAKRDWGFAGDYVEGMYRIMNHESPEDWVLATGKAYSVAEFATEAFNLINKNFEEYVQTSEKYLRPNEVNHLLGDSSKAQSILNWKPSTSFSELVKIMVENDIKLATKEKMLLDNKLIDPTWEHPIIN